MPQLVNAPTVKVDGTAISDALYEQLVDLRVEHTVSVPSSLTLRFTDPNFELVDATTFEVGKAVVVEFPTAGTATTTTLVSVFDGEIVSVGIEQNLELAEGIEFVVTAYDKSHRLGHTTTIRSFLEQKYDDIVSTIATAAGLSASVTATSVTHKYFLQTTNDYDTVNELARLLGFEWKVEGSTLTFGPRPDSPPPVVVTYGVDLRRIKVRFTASERTGTTTVRAWDPLTKQAIVGTDTSTAQRPPSNLGGTATIASNGRTKASAFVAARTAVTVPVASQAEANMLAKGIASRAAASDVYVRAECHGNPAIKRGCHVDIQNAGTRVSGKYYVTAVEHCFGRSGDYVTRFTCGGLESIGLVDLLGARDQQVPPLGGGFAVGIVTNSKDPDNQGRVKVKIPALSDTVESWWARVLTLGAGADTGLFIMPKVNDEVLVGFEHGDLRRPLVLGGLYGGQAAPPAASDVFIDGNNVIQWNLKTGQHNMIFRYGNQPTDKHIKLTLAGDAATFFLGSDKVELISKDKTVEIKNQDASILLTANGDVTIKGNKITLQAQQDVAIEGANVNVKAKSGAFKGEGVNVELKGSAGAKLESSAMTEIKGSMVKVN